MSHTAARIRRRVVRVKRWRRAQRPRRNRRRPNSQMFARRRRRRRRARFMSTVRWRRPVRVVAVTRCCCDVLFLCRCARGGRGKRGGPRRRACERAVVGATRSDAARGRPRGAGSVWDCELSRVSRSTQSTRFERRRSFYNFVYLVRSSRRRRVSSRGRAPSSALFAQSVPCARRRSQRPMSSGALW